MTVVVGAVVGCVAAVGLMLIVRGLVGVMPPVGVYMDRLHQGPTEVVDSWAWFDSAGDELDVSLELLDWSRERWRSHRLMFMVAVSGFVGVFAVLLWLLAVAPLWSVPIAAVCGAVAGWGLAWAHLRELVADVRLQASATVAVFLTLVQALMAAGAGPNSAISSAVLAGHGRVFELMRSAVMSAQLSNLDPWSGFGELGERVGIGELVALSASLRQASDGAAVAESLHARAASLRERDRFDRLAQMEAKAESMSFPLVAFSLAFVVLIGYPAVSLLLSV